MRFIVYMAVMIASVITCSAAKFSYRFSSVALSDALAQIHEDHPGLKINFIYNDLENYKTSSIVKTDNPYEAIRKVIGRNPVSVTVKNGILTDIYEQGFSYRIRFKKPGNTKLPLASIKANGKEYETPLTSVWVHPVDTNIDSVKCSIQLEDSYRKGVFTAIGICLLIAWLLIRLSFQKQKKIKRQDK